MKFFILGIGLFFLFSQTLFAGPGPNRSGGEDGPFPLACIDLSGHWKSDAGATYEIAQKKCSQLKIVASVGSQAISTTIVPDNKSRNISGGQWTGVVRHRWNSKEYGTGIETYRTIFFSDSKITENVVLELVNDNLLLESVYRIVQTSDGKKHPEYNQQVFRYVESRRDLKQGSFLVDRNGKVLYFLKANYIEGDEWVEAEKD